MVVQVFVNVAIGDGLGPLKKGSEIENDQLTRFDLMKVLCTYLLAPAESLSTELK